MPLLFFFLYQRRVSKFKPAVSKYSMEKERELLTVVDRLIRACSCHRLGHFNELPDVVKLRVVSLSLVGLGVADDGSLVSCVELGDSIAVAIEHRVAGGTIVRGFSSNSLDEALRPI